MDIVKSSRRAWRRHHRDRLKVRRSRYHGNFLAEVPPLEYARALGRVLATPKSCSCWMCGNPRHHWHDRTRQEVKGDLVLEEGLSSWVFSEG